MPTAAHTVFFGVGGVHRSRAHDAVPRNVQLDDGDSRGLENSQLRSSRKEDSLNISQGQVHVCEIQSIGSPQLIARYIRRAYRFTNSPSLLSG